MWGQGGVRKRETSASSPSSFSRTSPFSNPASPCERVDGIALPNGQRIIPLPAETRRTPLCSFRRDVTEFPPSVTCMRTPWSIFVWNPYLPIHHHFNLPNEALRLYSDPPKKKERKPPFFPRGMVVATKLFFRQCAPHASRLTGGPSFFAHLDRVN